MRSKQWRDLTAAQKRGIVLLGALQLTLLAAALIDIRRRPADALNGSKRLWTAVVFINFGSCRLRGEGDHHGAYEVRRHPFEIMRPLKDGAVLIQEPLTHTAEGT
jgi:hypothetical protein